MPKNYNETIQSNNTDLQAILNTINELPEAGDGSYVLQDKTVTPTTSKQTITADSGYDGLDTVTVNAMPTATQATPSITINASGLITATATQTAGYVAAGTKSATKQLAFQAAKTITPTTTNQTAVSSGYYTGGAVTVAGDSNLVAGNIKNGVSIFGVNGTYEGSGGSSGDTSIEDGLVTRTLTTYTNNRVTNIGFAAFASYSTLTSINFPNVIAVNRWAFAYCSKLTRADLSNATLIGSGAFLYCSSLTTINASKVTTISAQAFYSCPYLSSVNFPNVTTIEHQIFYSCSRLKTVDMPQITSISSGAFFDCQSLYTINCSKATYIGSSAFYRCKRLNQISLPVVTQIASGAFYACAFYSISFPKINTIGAEAFRGCTSLSIIYLTNGAVCSLPYSNAFLSTGITSSTGSIFVPSSLVASYKAATNWAYFSNRIFAAP